MQATQKIWMDGQFVDWDKAQVHVLSHTLHYGLGVFEGIRCYDTVHVPAFYPSRNNFEGFFIGALFVGMKWGGTRETIGGAILDRVQTNRVGECYSRPLVFLG